MSEFWNEKYSTQDYFYGTQANVFLTSVAGLIKEQSKVLCLAEGEGRNAVYLASLGLDVTAVDFSTAGREKALRLAQDRNVKIDYQLSSLENFNFGLDHWDAVISIFCHLPSALRKTIHHKAEKSLRPGGLFIVQAYHPDQLNFQTGGPKDLDMLCTTQVLKNDFTSLEWIKLENVVSDIFEGRGHTGKSSLVSGVAIRRSN